jgi:hypothetical protein
MCEVGDTEVVGLLLDAGAAVTSTAVFVARYWGHRPVLALLAGPWAKGRQSRQGRGGAWGGAHTHSSPSSGSFATLSACRRFGNDWLGDPSLANDADDLDIVDSRGGPPLGGGISLVAVAALGLFVAATGNHSAIPLFTGRASSAGKEIWPSHICATRTNIYVTSFATR